MKKRFDEIKALVVDDYQTIREKMVAALKGVGVKTTEVENGLEALSKLAEEEFDIVFTDIVMPEMDGFELCEEIRRNPAYRHLPIVVNSTHCDTKYIIKALRLGADDYVSKPIEPELVAKVVERIMTPVKGDS